MVTVARGPLQVAIEEDGRTRIKDRYVVSTPLAGRILRIQLRPGDRVETDSTVLTTIEPTDPSLLDPRARAEAEARVRAAEATVQQAGTNLERTLAAMQFAESELARMQRLMERGAITRERLEEQELEHRTRTQEYRSARFAQEIAEYELQQAQAALLRTQPQADTAGDDWQYQIRSPITGQVLRVFQESANVVPAGEQLLELGDPTDLEVEVDVLSSQGVRISPGDKVLLEEWGGDEPLAGVVRLVEPSAFTKVSALGVEEQRVNVIIDFVGEVEERQRLGHAFRVEARIIVWEEDDVLTVPTSALFRHGADWAVFAVVAGQAQLQTIEIGRRNNLQAEVLTGLQAGDQVIVHPSDRIQDGTTVVPR
jgi:HlyD family secretion protein